MFKLTKRGLLPTNTHGLKLAGSGRIALFKLITRRIASPDVIVRVDKEESRGNEGVVSGLVEFVHALVQVVLKQHEVNHNEASHGSSELEDERQLKI